MSLIAISMYPEKQYIWGALEFEKFGIPLLASPRSMSVIIQEKEQHFYVDESTPASARVKKEFRGLIYPSTWSRLEARLADALCAFKGILNAKGLL